jgi:hypothetical protein
MKYIEAPALFDRQLPAPPAIFLAGGITGCPNWQAEATHMLAEEDVTVLNPFRANFPIEDPNASSEQVHWEFHAMEAADGVLFWFPASGAIPQPIALYELGRCAALNRPMAVGADPGYCRQADVVYQMQHARPDIKVRATLSLTVADMLTAIAP